jgi:CubicO group peptidase (beta-lactamase class C family)
MKKRTLFLDCFSRGVMVAALATATVLTLAAGSSTKSSNQIDQVLREAVDKEKIPGVVAMVANADGVIYQAASGKRDTAKNAPMTVDSIFRIASMTKPITSVAVMQLVESGRVIESGTHSELLRANGVYARLYHLQFSHEEGNVLPLPLRQKKV